MLKIVIAVLVLVEVKQCHIISKRDAAGDLLKQLQSLQLQVNQLLNNKSKTTTEATTKATTPQPRFKTADDQNFQQRLISLEDTIAAIKTYLKVEKKKDITLKIKSEEIIEEMKSKVSETEDIIEGLKDNVKVSLQDFEHTIKEVNTSAHLSVNVEGVVYYGGYGSACSDSGDECRLDKTECRGDKCQCLAGLSYDWKTKACVSSCTTYGNTYQSFNKRIIRGFNNLNFTNIIDITECKELCNTQTEFVCKTIDFFPRWKQCYLSANSKSDAGVPEGAWEYNSVGKHFQRDCL